MARQPKPRYRKARGVWVCKVDGRLHTLARGRGAKAKAAARLAELLAARDQPGAVDLTVGGLFNRFLDRVQRDLAPDTYRTHKRHLKSAADSLGRDTQATDVKPIMVLDWASDPHGRECRDGGPPPAPTPWSRTTRHNAVAAVKMAYSWAFDQGLIGANPVARVRVPGPERREAVVDVETAHAVLDTLAGDPLADVLEFMYETGCRPTEAYRLEAAHLRLDDGLAVLPGKTTVRTGKPRIIHLTERAAELAFAAAERNPAGPIFRNRLGNPWTMSAVGSRLGRLRRRHGWPADVMPDAFRHGWITDAIMKGVPDKIVAELAGHQSTAMINKHYAHLARRAKELRVHAEAVRRKD